MIGYLVQYILYALVVFSATAGTASILNALAIRRGARVSNYFWQSILALLASTSPYIGLFGTVWHIIAALSGIGSGNLNVGEIAKPIGEALNATLWGLGSALIALISHRVALMLEPDDTDESQSDSVSE